MRKRTALSYEDQDGSLRFQLHVNVLEATFSGACGDDMGAFFLETLPTLIPHFQRQPWGYLNYSPTFTAATGPAIESFVEAYRFARQTNCVADAYCVGTSIGIAQSKLIRERCDYYLSHDQVIFATRQQAMDHLQERITESIRHLKG